MSNTGYTFD